jgi:urease accessory protein
MTVPTTMATPITRAKNRALLGLPSRKRRPALRSKGYSQQTESIGLQHAQRTPSPLAGEGWGEGSGGEAHASTEVMDQAALLRLMTWLSPAYPVGAFSYSSGIEWAVEAGDITDAASLRDWLAIMLTDGTGRNDAIFFSQTHRAVARSDDAALVEAAELAAALTSSRERHLETTTLGRAFVDVTCAAWPCDALNRLKLLWPGPIAYPVAAAAACAGHAIPLAPALHAFLAALVSNWISAGMRLLPLGHTDGQRLISALAPVVAATSEAALSATLGDLGGAAFRADLAGIKHETQYTRLFRS